jgi:hypothetical protein
MAYRSGGNPHNDVMNKQITRILAGLTCLIGAASPALAQGPVPKGLIFLEAEQFADTGGWDLDQQSMEVMGSPYLLAHGLGVPVRDAVTKAVITEAGPHSRLGCPVESSGCTGPLPTFSQWSRAGGNIRHQGSRMALARRWNGGTANR